ncbi:MAG: HD-GYP domain-containing protein [bacterium]
MKIRRIGIVPRSILLGFFLVAFMAAVSFWGKDFIPGLFPYKEVAQGSIRIVVFFLMAGLSGALFLRLPKGREIVVAEPVYYASIILLGPLFTAWLTFFGEFAGILFRKAGNLRTFSRAAQKTLAFGVGGVVFYAFTHTTVVWLDWEKFFSHLFSFFISVLACILVEQLLNFFVYGYLHFTWSSISLSIFIMAPVGILIAVLSQFQPLGLLLLFLSLAMLYRVAHNYVNLLTETREVVKVLATTVDERDRYTGPHSLRVMKYSEKIARELFLDEEEIEEIMLAARIHDLGNICLPDMILCKEKPLDEEEYGLVKRHPEMGWQLTKKLSICREEAELIHSHHEWYDGGGYPSGLKGSEIPLGARILAVAEAYESMIHPRPYRSALPVDEALKRLREGAGRQFDAVVIDVFLKLVDKELNLFSEFT